MLFASWDSLLRTLVTGVLVYVALVAILRVSGKRTLSKMSAFDLVVTVALGSTLATAMLSKQTTLADSVLAFLVLVLAQYAVARGALRWAWVERAVKAEPRLLVFRGAYLDEALRDERVTAAEVRAAVREKGLARVEDAAAVVLETDGTFSVLPTLGDGPPTALAGVNGADRPGLTTGAPHRPAREA